MPTASPKPQRLSDYEGELAEIVRLDLAEPEAERLRSMGIFEGQSVELCKKGNPLILTAAGGRVAMALEVARQIVVQRASIGRPSGG